MHKANPNLQAAWQEIHEVLDKTLGELPEIYRSVLLLCYLEGRTQEETAQQLGFLVNPFAGDSFGITAFALEGEPYLNPIKRLEWPKGAIQQEIEITLPRGVLVRGVISEAVSGKPVAGAVVEFWPHLRDKYEIQSGVA